MIKFLLKGIFRDHHRSLFPVLIVAIGVALTVFLQSWISGVLGDMIEFNAKFSTGHVKVMTVGYADNIDQIPNDYALTDLDIIMKNLQDDFPKKHKGPSLDDSTKRGFSFISLKINHGDSGTPSFINPLEENPIFFGLATGTYDIDDGTVNNMGIVTSSSDIIYSLKYYLDDLDSP